VHLIVVGFARPAIGLIAALGAKKLLCKTKSIGERFGGAQSTAGAVHCARKSANTALIEAGFGFSPRSQPLARITARAGIPPVTGRSWRHRGWPTGAAVAVAAAQSVENDNWGARRVGWPAKVRVIGVGTCAAA